MGDVHMNTNENKLFSIDDIDKAIKLKPDQLTYTLNDVILILLYSDKHHPLVGKIKQMKEIFLTMVELNILKSERIEFEFHRYGPYSVEVENAIDQLLFLNYISAVGSTNQNNFGIKIDEKGIQHIKDIYEKLPQQTRKLFSNKREEWNVSTSAGIINYVHTHYPEYRSICFEKNMP